MDHVMKDSTYKIYLEILHFLTTLSLSYLRYMVVTMLKIGYKQEMIAKKTIFDIYQSKNGWSHYLD